MVTSASFAYTVKCFHTQCWDLRGLESRRSFTTRWRTASLSRALGPRRGRRNDHLIDAGSTTTVFI